MERDEASGEAEEEEEEEAVQEEGARKGLSEYEKQRLSRIQENRARLEALGLPRLASTLLGSSSCKQQTGKRDKGQKNAKRKNKGVGGAGKGDEEDDEYRPSDGDGEGEDGESSSSGEEEEEDYKPSSSRRAPKRKGKKKSSSNAAKVRKSSGVKGKMKELEVIDDESALQQAIALSLGGATEDSAASSAGLNVADVGTGAKLVRASIQDTPAKRKRKGNTSRVQVTEDEVVAYFFSFDEAGKGQIALRDLQRMATAHDFCWTDIEMANMIYCFDSNGDGKLSLDDFRTIVARCNMMQESAKS